MSVLNKNKQVSKDFQGIFFCLLYMWIITLCTYIGRFELFYSYLFLVNWLISMSEHDTLPGWTSAAALTLVFLFFNKIYYSISLEGITEDAIRKVVHIH